MLGMTLNTMKYSIYWNIAPTVHSDFVVFEVNRRGLFFAQGSYDLQRLDKGVSEVA